MLLIKASLQNLTTDTVPDSVWQAKQWPLLKQVMPDQAQLQPLPCLTLHGKGCWTRVC